MHDINVIPFYDQHCTTSYKTLRIIIKFIDHNKIAVCKQSTINVKIWKTIGISST